VISVLATGCASSWQRAQEKDTIQAYRDFISNCESSVEKKMAQDRICRICWDRASSLATEQALVNLLDECPECWFADLSEFNGQLFVVAVHAKIQEISLEQATAIGTPGAYLEFLNEYAGSALADTALQRLDAILSEDEWRAVKGLDHPVAYRLFIERHEKSPSLAEAITRLAELDREDWETAELRNTAAAYMNYLRRHPDGVHKLIASQRIEKLCEDPAVDEINQNRASAIEAYGPRTWYVVAYCETSRKPHVVYKNELGDYICAEEDGEWVMPAGIDLPYLRCLPPKSAFVVRINPERRYPRHYELAFQSAWRHMGHFDVGPPGVVSYIPDSGRYESLEKAFNAHLVTCDRLIPLLAKSHAEEKAQIVRLLALTGRGAAAPALFDLLDDHCEDVSEAALDGLILLGPATKLYMDQSFGSYKAPASSKVQRAHGVIDYVLRYRIEPELEFAIAASKARHAIAQRVRWDASAAARALAYLNRADRIALVDGSRSAVGEESLQAGVVRALGLDIVPIEEADVVIAVDHTLYTVSERLAPADLVLRYKRTHSYIDYYKAYEQSVVRTSVTGEAWTVSVETARGAVEITNEDATGRIEKAILYLLLLADREPKVTWALMNKEEHYGVQPIERDTLREMLIDWRNVLSEEWVVRGL